MSLGESVIFMIN